MDVDRQLRPSRADLDAEEVAAALGLTADDLVAPVQQVSVGTSQVIAQAVSAEAVHRARTAGPLSTYAGMGARGGETLVYVWSPVGEGHIMARALISDGQAVSEDAATGSACSNLGAWMVAQGRSRRWTVSQGEQVARPSTLELVVSPEGSVTVGGLVRPVGSGEVVL